ncbi:uncharacterized protein TNCV_4280641 [Trichonephila clavipes]|nr:uncharacterized protein TNCV_4280641 [Trichonephila clavipes]
MNLPRHPQNSQSTTTFYCRQQEKPVNTVWQKLFVKQLMKMMEKENLAVAVDGSCYHAEISSSVKDMQQAIWAIFLHKLSTDEKPQHGFCPSDSDTWCKFKKQNCLGDLSSQNSLPVDVVEAMRPVLGVC